MAGTGVQVLDRALDIIEILATSEKGMGIAELSARTDLPKSTVHRILATLVSHQYIEKNADNSIYSLGSKFVEVASLYLNSVNLKTEAAPIMHELSNQLVANAYLGVLENDEVVYLECAEPFRNLRMYTEIGKREPVYCTALGKVLLAALPKSEFNRIVRGLSFTPYTSNSITNAGDLSREVELVRQQSYALDRGEHTEGSSCMAVPVYDYTRRVVAAMSISGFGLLENNSEETIYQKLKEASDRLSARMGHNPPAGRR